MQGDSDLGFCCCRVLTNPDLFVRCLHVLSALGLLLFRITDKDLDPLSDTVVRQWNKAYSCHGSRETFDVTVGQCLVPDANST